MASSAGPSAARQFFGALGSRPVFGILAWIPVGIFITQYGYSVATVTGASMQPALNPNIQNDPLNKDVVLLQRWASRFKRGDVVTLWSPTDPNLLTTKRIVGLPGDTVYPLPPHSPEPIHLPAGYCWVEGDSSYRTRDSNSYGPIPLGLIDSKVTRIIWPMSRWGPVENGIGKAADRVKMARKMLVSARDPEHWRRVEAAEGRGIDN